MANFGQMTPLPPNALPPSPSLGPKYGQILSQVSRVQRKRILSKELEGERNISNRLFGFIHHHKHMKLGLSDFGIIHL